MACSARDVEAFVRAYADVIAEHRAELIELDAAIGDADHGENLDRGMRAVLEALDQRVPATPGEVLQVTATTLISTVGGASGPLYGTAVLRAATAVKGAERLETDDVVTALESALGGLLARGKAELGDKTMVDAWTPAAEAARRAADDGQGLADVTAAAAAAAEQGMRATIPLIARKGRASYLGERSAGHQDPGATSTWLLFATLARCTPEPDRKELGHA